MKDLQVIREQEVLGKQFKAYGSYSEPLFLAKDVAEWIDYSKSNGKYKVSQMVATVDEEEKGIYNIDTVGGNQKLLFLTEDGLYEVLMQSRKPIAKKFKKKVKTILKEIRTTGKYEAEIKTQQKLFSVMEVKVESLVNEKIEQVITKCSDYFRPSSSEKVSITSYIKKRLGIEKANEEYELVKQRVLIKLNANKWEDVPVETLRDSLNIVDESIRIIKAERVNNQISIFDCNK